MGNIKYLDFAKDVQESYNDLKSCLTDKNIGTPSSLKNAISLASNIIRTHYNTETNNKFDSNWINIRDIINNDDFAGQKCILLLADTLARMYFNLSQNTKIKLSDGGEYINNGSSSITITHYWDLSKDVQYPGKSFKMRWAIIYKLDASGYDGFNNTLTGLTGSYYTRPIAAIYKNYEGNIFSNYEYLELINCHIPNMNCTQVWNFKNSNSAIDTVWISYGSKVVLDLDLLSNNLGLSGAGSGSSESTLNISNNLTMEIGYSSLGYKIFNFPIKKIISTNRVFSAFCLELEIKKVVENAFSVGNQVSYVKVNCDTSSITGTVSFNSDSIISVEFTNPINYNISISNLISLFSFVNLAEKLVDRTGETPKTITYRPGTGQLSYVYVKTIDNKLTIVDSSTDGAITLLEYITNKNWTIS